MQLSLGIERRFARPTRQDFLSGIGLISGEAYENQTIQLEHTMNKRFHIFMSFHCHFRAFVISKGFLKHLTTKTNGKTQRFDRPSSQKHQMLCRWFLQARSK